MTAAMALRVDPDPDHPLDVLALRDRPGLRCRAVVPGRDGHRTSRSRSDQPPSASDLKGFGPALATQFASFGVPYFVAYLLAMVASSRGGTSTATGWCARP